MAFSEQQKNELRGLCEQLATWISNNGHAHMTVIVDGNSAELCEGLVGMSNLIYPNTDSRQELFKALENADYPGWSDIQIDAFINQLRQSTLSDICPIPDMPNTK